ncbi:MAG: metallophosphoesterase [Lachnospiraceae bacterium]|nr:metallophosphoesterase [Lachnospiraceae bacterium]
MLNFMIGVLIIVILFFIGVMVYDGNRFHKVEYTVSSPKIHGNEKIIVLSDLHNQSYGKENEKLLQAIYAEDPDAIYVAGDMITSEVSASMENAISLMEKLAEKYPIYYGMGNHEYKLSMFPEKFGNMYQIYEDKMQKAGVRILRNEHIYLPESNIDVCGLEIERTYFAKMQKKKMPEAYVEKLAGHPRRDAFQILIAHNPDYFPQYAAWGADLVLSGHIHGGIMRLPLLGGVISPTLQLFPHYDGGRFEEGTSTMILSRGLGMHTLHIRIFNPGELVVIHLTEGKK